MFLYQLTDGYVAKHVSYFPQNITYLKNCIFSVQVTLTFPINGVQKFNYQPRWIKHKVSWIASCLTLEDGFTKI